MAAETGRTDENYIEGKTPGEDNQGALADGLMQIFKPAVEELDDKVISVRYSIQYWLFSVLMCTAAMLQFVVENNRIDVCI